MRNTNLATSNPLASRSRRPTNWPAAPCTVSRALLHNVRIEKAEDGGGEGHGLLRYTIGGTLT
jgi:hypothetical protein